VNATAPLVVVTDWGTRGILPMSLLLGVMAIAGIAYGYRLRAARAWPPAVTVAVAALALAAAWCAPLLFSSDVYAYAAYGELARLGLNPYVHPPILTHDALVRDAAWQWSGVFPVCVYGPLFVELAKGIVVAFAPLGTAAQLDAMRALASFAFLLCIPIAYAAYHGDANQRRLAAAMVGLNPVAIWCAAEGHNDALALLIVLAGFAIVARGRMVGIGAAAVALSGLVKLPGLAAAAALAVVDRKARAGATAGIAATGLLLLPLLYGAATQIAPNGRYAPQASLQAIVAPLGAPAAIAGAAALATALAIAGVRALRRRRSDGWIYLTLAAWVLVPNPYPWYALWLVAVAAIAPRTRTALVAVLLSFTSLLRYVPDAIGTPGAAGSALLGIVTSLPLLALAPGVAPAIMSDSYDG
jgi:hypothetical protein